MWDPALFWGLGEHAWRGGSGQPWEGLLRYYWLKNYLLCECICLLSCVYMYHLHAWCPQRPDKNVDPHAVGLAMVVSHHGGSLSAQPAASTSWIWLLILTCPLYLALRSRGKLNDSLPSTQTFLDLTNYSVCLYDNRRYLGGVSSLLSPRGWVPKIKLRLPDKCPHHWTISPTQIWL